jgi:hypothetical protein
VDHDGKHDRTKDWRELCRETATELDPVKLMKLIAELTRALNERDRRGPGMAGQENKTARAMS